MLQNVHQLDEPKMLKFDQNTFPNKSHSHKYIRLELIRTIRELECCSLDLQRSKETCYEMVSIVNAILRSWSQVRKV